MADQVIDVKHNFPGLLREKLPSGAIRFRVRAEGNKLLRTAIPVGPDHADFYHHYTAAREGRRWEGPPPESKAVAHSIQWLVDKYLAHLGRLVDAGQASKLTLQQRRSQLRRLCAMPTDDGGGIYGEYDMCAPRSAFIAARDQWSDKPGEANNLIKSVSAMYRWAIDEAELLAENPVKGIKKLAMKGEGAAPKTPEDLKKFRDRHPLGTTAHLWLTLQMFTACRVDDARKLGRRHEVERAGEMWLDSQPGKKGSAPVSIPMMAPLLRAVRAQKVQGATYLLTDYGKPLSTAESLRNRVRKWCAAAGIEGKSSHGIRKAVAELLAEAGCSQHQIMAIMAHTQAKTSEIYTKGAQRRLLAADALAALSDMEW
ncbi:tyrosine recombinase XerC [Cereibacter johrii]|uniref:Site-specific recombinase XerC n=1 Tax=Cereibacter johrii TaxID=445629 RepID=A0ABX5J3X5_9RHOB|nr:tyrosine-type recombinase/integrase [Cereibacter johrii]PTM75830.1 site-specific recombinase XerC [Cereibacter johrii]